MTAPHSDALVFFGATGDLAYKQIFPALHAPTSTRPDGIGDQCRHDTDDGAEHPRRKERPKDVQRRAAHQRCYSSAQSANKPRSHRPATRSVARRRSAMRLRMATCSPHSEGEGVMAHVVTDVDTTAS